MSWLIFGAFVFPFLTAQSFTTLDGPGHIHNANIMLSLLSDTESAWAPYAQLNTYVSPNLLGHYLLLIVIQIVGEHNADCTMVVFCMASLFFALRYLLRVLQVDRAMLLLPLCFLLNTPLFSGFFSFMLGLAAMFVSTAYFLRLRDVMWKGIMPRRQSLILALMLVVTYLLHLVPAVLAGLFIAIAFLTDVFQKRHEHNWKINLLWKPSRVALLAALPVSTLVVLYQLHDAETSQYVFIESKELLRQWGVMQGLIINNRSEWAFTRWYWIAPAAALLIDMVWMKLQPNAFQIKTQDAAALPMLVSMLMVLGALYFIMPDASSGGGALSVRLNFLLVLFSVIVLFIHMRTALMRFIACAALVIVVFDHRNKILAYHEEHAFFMRDIQELNAAFDKPGVLLVHRFRYDWPFEHCTKYLGINQQIVHVDALGGHKIYAPVMWSRALRNQPDLVAMFDKGWQQDPQNWLRFFPGEQVHVLAIGNPSAADSASWTKWQYFMQSKSAVETWSADSVMHVYAFEQ